MTNYFKIILSYIIWLILWSFTPGLISLNYGIGALFSNSTTIITLIDSILTLIILSIMIYFNLLNSKNYFLNNLSKKSILIILLILLITLVTLPFHYHMQLPMIVYIIWMLSSVLWQNYITFGLLYNFLKKHLNTKIINGLIPIIFTSGHLILIPSRFNFHSISSVFMILIVGIILIILRIRTKNISWQVMIHLAFYYLFS